MEERRVESVAEKVEDKLGREDVPRDVVEATLDVVAEAMYPVKESIQDVLEQLTGESDE